MSHFTRHPNTGHKQRDHTPPAPAIYYSKNTIWASLRRHLWNVARRIGGAP